VWIRSIHINTGLSGFSKTESRTDNKMQMFFVTLAFLPALALADNLVPAPAYGYAPAPAYCRETQTSVYAEVCVPAFTNNATPVELKVKNIVDNDYCYNQIRTVCEETTKEVERVLCTSNYVKKAETLSATTTQVTSEIKSETMRVTSCHASGYGHAYGDSGEHQYCREEYQTQQYSVPLVTVPLVVSVEVAAPQPVETCVTKTIVLTEVVCKDIEEQKCFNVAKFEDGINTVEQVEVILGEPKCDRVTLSLPTKVCPVAKTYGH